MVQMIKLTKEYEILEEMLAKKGNEIENISALSDSL